MLTPPTREDRPKAAQRRQIATYYAGPAGDAWSHGRKPDGPNPYHDPLRSSKCSPAEAVTGQGGPGLRVIEPCITIKPRKSRWPELLRPRHLSPVISKKANLGRNDMRKLMTAAAFALLMSG